MTYPTPQDLRHQLCNARGWPCGETHYNAKFTEEQVKAAIARVKAGETAASVARELGTHRSYVAAWASGKRRKPPPPPRVIVRTRVRWSPQP